MCTHIHSGNGTLWRVGFTWTYRRLPQLLIFHRTVPLQDWLHRDSALKAQSAHCRDPSPTSSCLILNPAPLEHPAPSSVRGPPALTQTQQEMSRRRSPGPKAVTYQQDGTNPAEPSPPLTPPHTDTHPRFRRGLRRWQPAARLCRRSSPGAAHGSGGAVLTHPSAGGGAARTSAGSRVPSDGSGPAARPDPGNPRPARGERGCGGGGGSPAERPSSRRADPPRRCPAAGQEQGKG